MWGKSESVAPGLIRALAQTLRVGDAEASRLRAQLGAAAAALGTVDGLLAATAAEHDMILVTRDSAMHPGLGVPVLDPFAEP
jgi:predicted nucleic acid-binding protein